MAFFFILLHHIDLFYKLGHRFGTFRMNWRLFTRHWVVYLESSFKMWKMICAFI